MFMRRGCQRASTWLVISSALLILATYQLVIIWWTKLGEGIWLERGSMWVLGGMILVIDHLGIRFFSYINTLSRCLISCTPTFQDGLRDVPSVLSTTCLKIKWRLSARCGPVVCFWIYSCSWIITLDGQKHRIKSMENYN